MSDRVMVQAFGELAEVLDHTAEELSRLAGRARTLAAEADAGRPLLQTVAEEERPLIVECITGILDSLGASGAKFRRTEARVLHEEGLSHERIAALFGVTRQRVGALLAAPPSEAHRALEEHQP
jgi:hypothetical protein